MIRRRRSGRRSPVAADGDLVIDGRIRARLLGLPLLDLDAHVVVGPARARGATPAGGKFVTPRPSGRASVTPPTRRAPLGNGARVDGQPASALGRAVRLLDEGSTALDDARRIRRQALTTPGALGPSASQR